MRVLLTGATGFVGSHLHPTLRAAGHRVRCLTRDATRARAQDAHAEWFEADLADEARLGAALEGCDAAYFLVHGMADGHRGYEQRELEDAARFARAAERAGVERIIYLGGVAPREHASKHLRSRLAVGELLRAGRVPTLELRASMIVGHGSLSWLIVRDLVARLPVMVLPRWLRSRTEPVAIDDVVAALVGGLTLPAPHSRCFDVPGPDVLSGREILEATALAMGLRPPRMLEVPILTPRLSSLWVRFVTRARWSVAREIVTGLTEDLLAHDDTYWRLIGHPERIPFVAAAADALAAAARLERVPGVWGAIERQLTSLRQRRRLT